MLISHPAHLWIGSYQHMIPTLITALQKVLCPNQGCTHCRTCIHIQERRHQSIYWLKPENQYTREDLEPVFHISSFVRDHKDYFFFIIEKADYFNQSCANSLLKTLEEPPHGYHFILLAQRETYILPTIRSRCLITLFSSQESSGVHDVITWFTSLKFPESSAYMTTIDTMAIGNLESIEILDKILHYWLAQQTESLHKGDLANTKKTKHILAILQEAFEKAPMPGSSKLFWKDLFLQFHYRNNIT